LRLSHVCSSNIADLRVSFNRIQAFLDLPVLETKVSCCRFSPCLFFFFFVIFHLQLLLPGDPDVCIEASGSFVFGDGVSGPSLSPALVLPRGTLTAVVGRVGSGKRFVSCMPFAALL
jgi:hypothetical protein